MVVTVKSILNTFGFNSASFTDIYLKFGGVVTESQGYSFFYIIYE